MIVETVMSISVFIGSCPSCDVCCMCVFSVSGHGFCCPVLSVTAPLIFASSHNSVAWLLLSMIRGYTHIFFVNGLM